VGFMVQNWFKINILKINSIILQAKSEMSLGLSIQLWEFGYDSVCPDGLI